MAIWFLPENIADMLPDEALRTENARRCLVDLYRRCGFELVDPPLIEYIDSLLTGSGSDLDLKTFKLIDQASGRSLGLRADFTPQAARIDAHILNREGVTRLCYSGSVLHAQPRHPLASRQPVVAGAEMFGATGRVADCEMIELAVASLRALGLRRVHIDLGHTAVLHAILEADPAAAKGGDGLFDAIVAKDVTGLERASAGMRPETLEALALLMRCWGGPEALDELRSGLPPNPAILEALDEVAWLGRHCGADDVTYDFADIHGYGYLTGVTLSAHVEGISQAVLRGGRYDDIGRAFGRARPAVGFTVYLRDALEALGAAGLPHAVLAPADSDIRLREMVAQLRTGGLIVVHLLPGESAESLKDSFVFDREIALVDGQWTLRARQAV